MKLSTRQNRPYWHRGTEQEWNALTPEQQTDIWQTKPMDELRKLYYADPNFAWLVDELTNLMSACRWGTHPDEQEWQDAMKLAEHMHERNEKANL